MRVETLAAGASVTAASFEAGYQSVSAFVSIFRQTFGPTPGRYFRVPSGIAEANRRTPANAGA